MSAGPRAGAPLPPGVELFDAHCHLDEPRFAVDRDAVVARAHAAGVTGMVTIGASEGVASNHAALAVAEHHPAVWTTVGVHPHDARLVSPAVVEELAALARHPKVVAVGETGLDYYYDHSPRPVQQEALRQFVALARRLGLPLVLHLRDAAADALAILRAERAADVGGVVHCFSDDRRVAAAFLDLGFDLSFSGIVTFKNADEVRAVVRFVPAERYMVETDAPYLAPVPHRGRRNEPAFVVHTAAAVAALRGVTLDVVAAQTSATTRRRFRLPAG